MAFEAKIVDTTTGMPAGVDSSGQLKIGLPAAPGQDYVPGSAGYVKVGGQNGQPLLMTTDGHLCISHDQLLVYDQVDGAALNTNTWEQASATLVIAQASGLITLNSTLLTTAAGHARINSIKRIPLYGTQPVVVSFGAIVNATPQTNATMEMGIGTAATIAAPTDGVFFRWAPDGNFYGVMNYGGVETTVNLVTPPTINSLFTYVIIIDNEQVYFAVNGMGIFAKLSRPAAQPYPVSDARQPIHARVYNGAGAPATAPRLQIGNVMAVQAILNMNRDWPTALAALGRGSYQSPVTTFAQTQNFTNSTAPTNATLSNTTPGYTTLGGKFAFAAPAGAVTDFALFGYQVPAGFQLFVTRVDITCVNIGAAVATTPTILDWGIGLNSSAASLATVDGVGTWAPRRRAMGMMSFVVADPIGRLSPELVNTYDPPMVVDGGRYFHVIVQVPVGTATASQVLRGCVSIHGYFE